MNYLTYLPVWEKLEKSQQETLTDASSIRSYKKGAILHNGSADCAGLFLIIKGQLRSYILSDEGREVTLYRLFEQDMTLFSASCMMNSIQFDIIISAEKDTEVLHIPTDNYKRIMEISAPLANYTSELMASRFSDVMWLIDQVMWKSFDKRLAEFLLNESTIEETNVLHITQEAIGNHLGNPREVVTRMLKYFANEGLVSLSRGTVTLVDEKGLSRLIQT